MNSSLSFSQSISDVLTRVFHVNVTNSPCHIPRYSFKLRTVVLEPMLPDIGLTWGMLSRICHSAVDHRLLSMCRPRDDQNAEWDLGTSGTREGDLRNTALNSSERSLTVVSGFLVGIGCRSRRLSRFVKRWNLCTFKSWSGSRT